MAVMICLAIFGLSLFKCAGAEYSAIKLNNQLGKTIPLSTFGFLKGGSMDVNVTLTFAGPADKLINKLGFRFDKSSSGGRAEYLKSYDCPLYIINSKDLTNEQDTIDRAILQFKWVNATTTVLNVSEYNFANLTFFSNQLSYKEFHNKTEITSTFADDKKKRDVKDSTQTRFMPTQLLPANVQADDNSFTLSTTLYFQVDTDEQAGLYEMYFHNCNEEPIVSGKINIVETNAGSYLSAGELMLPLLYGVVAVIVFLTSFVWVVVLWKNRGKVFAIHYLMAAFMFIKTLSVTFHSVDYHFIGRDGKQEAWAVIFYIVHLLKGTLLFICLLLIGTGWAFIKYVLSDREKKLFMIVIPLQVVANVAYMIRGEEQGIMTSNTVTWTQIMFLIDILCFIIILISIMWSVRHLQEASETDGKAAINLNKLKLFQHFYVMVICYLYFIRVVVYFLQITLPFHYTWIHHLFYEVVSLIFFIVTGYKFRPGCDNPYLSIPQEDEDDIESHAITESGMTETIVKVNQYESRLSDEEEKLLPKQRHKTSVI